MARKRTPATDPLSFIPPSSRNPPSRPTRSSPANPPAPNRNTHPTSPNPTPAAATSRRQRRPAPATEEHAARSSCRSPSATDRAVDRRWQQRNGQSAFASRCPERPRPVHRGKADHRAATFGERRATSLPASSGSSRWAVVQGNRRDSTPIRAVAIRLDAENRIKNLADDLRQHQADP